MLCCKETYLMLLLHLETLQQKVKYGWGALEARGAPWEQRLLSASCY